MMYEMLGGEQVSANEYLSIYLFLPLRNAYEYSLLFVLTITGDFNTTNNVSLLKKLLSIDLSNVVSER